MDTKKITPSMSRADFEALKTQAKATCQPDPHFFEDDKAKWDGRNNTITDYWLPFWQRNVAENFTLGNLVEKYGDKLPADLMLSGIKQSESLGRIRRRFGPCLVLGAGASLDKQLPKLKDCPCPIIACNSVMKALMAHGVEPEFCNVFDGGEQLVLCFDGVKTPNTKYLCSTAIHPNVVKAIRRTGGILRFYDKGTKGHIFFDQVIPALFDDKKFNSVPTGGCVVNASLYIANQLIGFSVVGLAGVDFGYTDNRYRCKDYRPEFILNQERKIEFTGKWTLLPEENEKIKHKEIINQAHGVGQWDEHVVYSQVAEAYYKQGCPIINCTEGGALTEIPRMPLEIFFHRCRENTWQAKGYEARQ